MGQSWIQGGTIFVPYGLRRAHRLGVWKYPRGGNPRQVFTDFAKSDSTLYGVTISAFAQ